MRMNVAASAPGKLLLLGEYAVLEGAPAVSMAVNRRAGVRLQVTGEPEIWVRAPDVVAGIARLRPGQGGWTWEDSAMEARLPLVARILGHTLGGFRGDAAGGFELALDTQAFFATRDGLQCKLGLGSSAALTVACARAVLAHVGGGGNEQVVEIHRQFQDGRGSGVDVATSLHGGTIVFRRDPGAVEGRVDRYVSPTSVHYCVVWSGRPVSTPDMLEKLAAWRQRQPSRYRACMAALLEVAEAGVVALIDDQGAELIRQASCYAQTLAQLDAASGLGIVSAEHQYLAGIAQRVGVAYKSCGAGGDLGIALSLDRERLAHFEAEAAGDHFLPVALTVGEPGLRCEFIKPEAA